DMPETPHPTHRPEDKRPARKQKQYPNKPAPSNATETSSKPPPGPTTPAQQPAQGLPAERHTQMQQAAQLHYQQNMQSENGAGPRNYLEGRELGALVAGTAIAGYATKEWTDLVDHLREHGFTDDEIMAGGLGVETKYGTVVDRFRERITLPIHDDNGDIAGFIGRAPDQRDPRAPKYLNTPTVDGFNKSEAVYGLHEAADRDRLTSIVV